MDHSACSLGSKMLVEEANKKEPGRRVLIGRSFETVVLLWNGGGSRSSVPGGAPPPPPGGGG
jgi:hypothetical protein